jgi:DNA repair exonuclease SbcCD ATPase subunit
MTDDELKRLMRAQTTEIRHHFDVAMESNRHEIGLIAEKVIRLDEKFTGLDEKFIGLDQKFTGLDEKFIGLDEKFIGLDEKFIGLDEKFTRLDEKLDKTSANLSQRIEQTAAETQAMIKFSHADLDRRLRTVEESVSDLQARVERIESSTH